MIVEKILNAEYGSPEHPLDLGGLEIQAYVLEDGRRVLYQGQMVQALGMSRGSSGGSGGDRLAKFVAGQRLEPFVGDALRNVTADPIKFKTPKGAVAYGYEATVLADICEAVLAARDSGVLQRQQMHIARQCEILVRGFARVGIIALVDEVTGYQDFRTKRALAEILEKFISKELQPWTRRFPEEFYKQIFRLRGWKYDPTTVKRPSVIGKMTNDIVYDRLAPGVLAELRRKNPVTGSGRRKHKHHQWFTDDVGHPRLREHLYAVVALMKASPTWDQFKRSIGRAFPKPGDTIPLELDD